MVEAARRVGASAKFTGSGGAIGGVYKDKQMLKALKKELGSLNVKVVRPKIVGSKKAVKV
jgi:glucuronokinase